MADRLLTILAEGAEAWTSHVGGAFAWAGLDCMSLAEAAHRDLGKMMAAKPEPFVPMPQVRAALASMLRSGKLRRRLLDTSVLEALGSAEETSGGESPVVWVVVADAVVAQ